jgi:hypothetical protein
MTAISLKPLLVTPFGVYGVAHDWLWYGSTGVKGTCDHLDLEDISPA